MPWSSQSLKENKVAAPSSDRGAVAVDRGRGTRLTGVKQWRAVPLDEEEEATSTAGLRCVPEDAHRPGVATPRSLEARERGPRESAGYCWRLASGCSGASVGFGLRGRARSAKSHGSSWRNDSAKSLLRAPLRGAEASAGGSAGRDVDCVVATEDRFNEHVEAAPCRELGRDRDAYGDASTLDAASVSLPKSASSRSAFSTDTAYPRK